MNCVTLQNISHLPCETHASWWVSVEPLIGMQREARKWTIGTTGK
jgi:hypothetical protein